MLTYEKSLVAAKMGNKAEPACLALLHLDMEAIAGNRLFLARLEVHDAAWKRQLEVYLAVPEAVHGEESAVHVDGQRALRHGHIAPGILDPPAYLRSAHELGAAVECY